MATLKSVLASSGERFTRATDAVARLLFSDYTLPFEAVSVLLLAAVIGGIFLAKRDPGRDEAER